MIRIPCPAKLNLFLSVGPRDSRGFHPIRTVFQAISLFDELQLERSSVDSFECDRDLPEANTVTRAWSLLREVVPLPPLRVVLRKGIPTEAGLGGGSSDAAGLLRGVEALLELEIPRAERAALALAVGADVPFFLLGGRAVGEGYGEKLTPLPDPTDQWAVVVKPSAGCPTGLMYRALDQKDYPWRELGEGTDFYNDFERVAPCQCLDLIERLQVLGADKAGLSGSGSAVFGTVPDRPHAERLAARLATEGHDGAFVVKFLSRAESTHIS
ncbi:MAG TPA: 4-(cytidine 5'-diphospho)-2-C-methyl-D-erythritol kinase [Fimbriimonas sp.]